MAEKKKLNVPPRKKRSGGAPGKNKSGSRADRGKGGRGGRDLPHNQKDAACITMAKDESEYAE